MARRKESRVHEQAATYAAKPFAHLMRETQDLVEELRKNPNVSAVVLFGSQATGKARPNSDADLAVLLNKTDRETEAEVGSMYSEKIDLALFHRLPLYIQFRVFREGKTLYVGDEAHLLDTKLRTMRGYHEMQYHYEKRKKHIMTT